MFNKNYVLPISMVMAMIFCAYSVLSHENTLLYYPQPSGTTPPCVDTIQSSAMSPDKTWNAIVYSELCEGDYPFQTSIITAIKLESLLHKRSSDDVFCVDNESRSKYIPTVSWNDQHSLIIYTFRGAITLKKTRISMYLFHIDITRSSNYS